jgi:cell division transport system permease protein
MMAITFFMVSVFILIAFVSSSIFKHFETKPQVLAFYPNDTPESEILDIKKQLESTKLTKDVKYISSTQAAEEFKKDTKDIGDSVDLASEKILPPSLEISAWNLSDLKTIKSLVEKKDGVKVIYIEEVVDKLSTWLNGLRTGGLILLTLLMIESILVIWTIIGMRISQRKHEIEIMRLLGATSWYIRAPFIFEGVLYGFIGGFIGVSITIGLLFYAIPGVQAFLTGVPVVALTPQNFLNTLFLNPAETALDGIPLFPVTPLFMLLFTVLVTGSGMLIGAVGSLAAVIRSLKK